MRALLILLYVLFALNAQAAPPQQPAGNEMKAQEHKEVTGYTLPPEKYRKAIAFARIRYTLYFISIAYGLLLLLIMLDRRWASKFREVAEKASSRRFLQALIYVPLLLLTLAVLSLPLDLCGQWFSVKYEQSVQGWGSWFWDWTKGQLIALAVSALLVWILYGVIRRSQKRWWFYFWLASLPIIIFLMFVSPYVVEPLFFKFEPLEQKQPILVSEIGKVVNRGGLSIPRERMFEMKASEKLKSMNAYVSGFGASQRVVVWDTTLAGMSTAQTLAVFGHEMGHYVLGHIPRSIVFMAILLLLFLYLGFRGMHLALSRWGERWGIRAIEDWASLPVLMLLLTVFSFLASPITNTYSRYQEHEADVYGLEVTHGIVSDSSKAAAEAFQILGEINLSDPNPNAFIKFWLYSHPPLNERIKFARSYDPWSEGKPKFVK